MQKIWQKFMKTKEAKGLALNERLQKLSVGSERIIKRISSTTNKLCAPQVTCEFISGCSATISATTVRRILKNMLFMVTEASGNLS